MYSGNNSRSDKNLRDWQKITIKMLAVLAVIGLVVAGVLWVKTEREQTFTDTLAGFSQQLDLPNEVVGVESCDNRVDSNGYNIACVVAVLLEHHLQEIPNVHPVILPQNVSVNEAKSLQRHYGDNVLFKRWLKPSVQLFGDTFIAGFDYVELTKDGTRRKEFTIELPVSTLLSELPELENKLLESLDDIGILDIPKHMTLNKNTEANKAFLKAARYRAHPFVYLSKEAAEASIKEGLAGLKENQSNRALFALLVDNIIALMMFNKDINVERNLSILDSVSRSAVDNYPNEFLSYYARAEYYCFMQEYDRCMHFIGKALKLNSYDNKILSAISWNLRRFSLPRVVLNEHNYFLNPYQRDSLFHLRNALLANSRVEAAVQLTEQHPLMRHQARYWSLLAQKKTSHGILTPFSRWYRQELSTANTIEQPTYYLGYMLLNANHPELARYWIDSHYEDLPPYFDLRVINLMADIWQEQWDPTKWRVEKALVNDRREFQNAIDKLRIAYFDLHTGHYNEAKSYILEVFPELAEDDVVISMNNFRYAVYFSEIAKRTNNSKKAEQLTKKLHQFLHERPHFSRDVFFGLADVEFYALNNHVNKAIERLRYVLKQDNWLPNAYWMWPPLEQNSFLSSLRDVPEFNYVKRLTSVEPCLDREDCNNP